MSKRDLPQAAQQQLDLGPITVLGKFNQSYQTHIFAVSDTALHVSKGLKSTDLIPFFIHDKRKLSLVGRVTAAEATSQRLVEIDGKSASLTQKAANITSKIGKNKGQAIFRHLGEREETVLDALKYIASRDSSSFGEYQGQACLKFTVGQIQSVVGSSYNRNEILEALDVLHGSDTELRIQALDGSGSTKPIKSALLPILITHEDPENADLFINDNAKFMCAFHPIFTKDIATLNFRQINYGRIRERSSGLAKHIEKRLSHNYTQASEKEPYGPIFGSSILKGAGLGYDANNDADSNFKSLFRAIKELKVPDGLAIEDLTGEQSNTYILAKVEVEPIYLESLVRRRRIVDYKLIMYPTPHFINQQIEANIEAKKDVAKYNLARELNISPNEMKNLKVNEY